MKLRYLPLAKLPLVAIKMVLQNQLLAVKANHLLMAFPRVHRFLRSIAIRNKLMHGTLDTGHHNPAPAVAGLAPHDPLNCPRRVRAMYKALELGLHHTQDSGR